MLEEFRKVAEEIAKIGREKRGELPYREGAIGITTLLYCPRKLGFRLKGIEVKTESPAIDRGFIIEDAVKEAVKRVFGEDKVIEEKTLSLDIEVGNKKLKLDVHPDLTIEKEDEVVLVEIKAMNQLISRKLKPEPFVFINDSDKNYMIPENYIKQTAYQKYVAQKVYKKPVKAFLFIMTTLKARTKTSASYVIVEVQREISDEEFSKTVLDFIRDLEADRPAPRYPWECYFCPYRREGYCEGTELPKEEQNGVDLAELVSLLKEREETKAKLKSIEEEIKKIVDTIRIGDETYGWVEEEKITFNLPKLSKVLKEKGLSILPYIQLNWRKRDELLEVLGDDVERVIEERKIGKRFIMPYSEKIEKHLLGEEK